MGIPSASTSLETHFEKLEDPPCAKRRRYWVISDVLSLPERKKWANFIAVGCVESQRTL